MVKKLLYCKLQTQCSLLISLHANSSVTITKYGNNRVVVAIMSDEFTCTYELQ